MTAPSITTSTPEERKQFVLQQYKCISDCDMCGNCILLHNRSELDVYADYIEGKRTFEEITLELRY